MQKNWDCLHIKGAHSLLSMFQINGVLFVNNVLNYRQSDDFVEKHDRSHVKVEHEVLKN